MVLKGQECHGEQERAFSAANYMSIRHLGHWCWVTHICVTKLTSIGSDNGLSPGRRQAIIWTNAGILLIGPLATNFSEILIEIHTFSFMKMHLKMSSGKMATILSRPQCVNQCVDLWITKLKMSNNWLLHSGVVSMVNVHSVKWLFGVELATIHYFHQG